VAPTALQPGLNPKPTPGRHEVLCKLTAGPPDNDHWPLVAFVVDARNTASTLSLIDVGPDNETVGAGGGGGGGGVVACVPGGAGVACVTGTAVVGGVDDVVLTAVVGTVGTVAGNTVVGAAACFEPFLLL
jgi:hypothetical protein